MARIRYYETRTTYSDRYVTQRSVKSRSYGGQYATPQDKAAYLVFAAAAIVFLVPGGALGWWSIPIYVAEFIVIIAYFDRKRKRRERAERELGE
jgi:hypothetical protein